MLKFLELIKGKINILIRKDIFFILLIILIMLSFTGIFFDDFLQSKVVGGWDGQNHYAIVKYYSDNIFPEPFGWVSNWNAGMPWPLGYNPFFSYLMAFLFHVIPLSSTLVFKLFFIVLTFLFPIVIYYLSKRLKFKKVFAFLAGVLASIFLILPYQLGVSIKSTFLSGLYPQFFASFLYLLWLFFFFKFDKNKRSYFLSVILLALVFISNTHVSEFAVITFFSFFIVDIIFHKNFINLKKYLTHLVFSLGLTSFWLIPYLSNSSYFPYITMSNITFNSFLEVIGIIITIFFTGFVAFSLSKKKNIIALFLTLFFTVFIVIFPIKKILPSLPLQPMRLLPLAFLLVVFFIPLSIEKIFHFLSLKKISKYLVLSIFILSLVFSARFYLPQPLSNGFFMLNSEIQSIDFLKNKNKGRSIIEAVGWESHAAMAAIVGTESNHQTIWNVFRESSISSIFNAPLRNSFSFAEESFGVSCMLCSKDAASDFYNQPFLNHLKRAELYNTKYFLVSSYKIAKPMIKTYADKFTLLKSFDPWNIFPDINSDEKEYLLAISQDREIPFLPWYVFEYKEEISNFEVPKLEPALIFTNLETKNREYLGEESYNWLRIAEEWFFQADFKTILVHPKNLYLDKTKDLDKFKIAVIVDTKYKDFDKAYQNLIDYTKDNKLIIFKSNKKTDPLIDKIEKENNDNVFFLEKKENPRKGYKDLLNLLNSFNLKALENKVVDYCEKPDKIIIETEKQVDNQKIFIKNSYFPLWEDQKGGEVYMASPTFQLVLTNNNEIELEFNKNKGNIFVIGSVVSLISLLFLLIFTLFYNKKR